MSSKKEGSNAATAVIDVSKKKKRPQKIFGVMTKRRWFGVVVFLSAMLWSYTAGPPLPDSIICNRYFLDGTSYDYKTVAFEGNINLIDRIFKRGFWPDVFTWQVGAYFDWPEGPMWSSRHGKLIFSDTIQNNIFSWSPINGIQIEIENAGQVTDSQLNTLSEPGSNGILEHPTDPDSLLIAQHGQRRIISYNLATKKYEVVADKYKGKKLNSPNDLVLGPKGKYIYFTDPPYGLNLKSGGDKKSDIGFSGIYRFKLGNKNSVELVDKSFKRPNGIAFSSDNKRLFVSDCIEGEFKLNVYSVENDKIKLYQTWDEKSVLKNNDKLETRVNPLSGGVGCVDGLTVMDKDYLVTTCPGGKLCLIHQKNGDLEALIKLPDKTRLTNVAVGDDRNLYITANHTVWQLRLQP